MSESYRSRVSPLGATGARADLRSSLPWWAVARSGQPSGRSGRRCTWRGYSVVSEIEHLSEQLVFKCQMLSNGPKRSRSH
jgi:hypothetical protein